MISVVIPSRNDRPEYLAEALQSVVNQIRLPSELILVFSGDQEADFKPVGHVKTTVLRSTKPLGASGARNLGASASTQDYISFLDDDDLWPEDYLALVEQEVLKSQADAIVARLDQLRSGRVVPWKDLAGLTDLSTLFVKNPGATGSSITVKKTAFFESGGFDESLETAEDKSLIIDMLLSGHLVVGARHIQAINRFHQASLTHSPSAVRGTARFLSKYRNIMSPRCKIHNYFKLVRYSYLLVDNQDEIQNQKIQAKLVRLLRGIHALAIGRYFGGD